jgi:hypothetical protein
VLSYFLLSAFFLIGTIVSLAFLVAEYWHPATTIASKEEKKSTSVFRYEKDAFIESRRIRRSDGSDSELYETNYYLPIWNAIATGQPLKAVKARIFMMGQEPVASSVKETGQYSVDLRHGEVALFKIGRTVSYQPDFISGFVTFNDQENKNYITSKPEYEKSFEVFSASGKVFGIRDAMPDGAPETRWLTVIVSADDVVSLPISVFLDFHAKRLIRFGDADQEDPKNGK